MQQISEYSGEFHFLRKIFFHLSVNEFYHHNKNRKHIWSAGHAKSVKGLVLLHGCNSMGNYKPHRQNLSVLQSQDLLSYISTWQIVKEKWWFKTNVYLETQLLCKWLLQYSLKIRNINIGSVLVKYMLHNYIFSN